MRFKRLIASVTAGFDDFVARVENHEAVADCLIDDVRQATARVRVQHAQAVRRIERLERQRRQLDADHERWNQRALTHADHDEAKALECIRRARQAEADGGSVDEQLTEHRRLAADLKSRLEELERRLDELKQKRTALSSRAGRARALGSVRAAGCESVDAVFDRWETAVVADEYRDEALADAPDPLERELRDEEEAAELKAALDALKASRGGAS